MRLKNEGHALVGTLQVPGDKSISHRSVMFGAIAYGQTRVEGFLYADDCLSTVHLFKQLGVAIWQEDMDLIIEGKGIECLEKPKAPIDVGNSGTTMRLGAGILAATSFATTLVGDESLNQRPMERIMTPLNQMNALIKGSNDTQYPPLTIKGASLKGITYELPIASAQVKSAILLAALHAKGPTELMEKELTRNHTEEMITQFGGKIHVVGKKIYLEGKQKLTGTVVKIPGDISSAAFFMAAALMVPNSCVTLTNVGMTHTRSGILDIIKAMNGHIQLSQIDEKNQAATVTVTTSQLIGTVISGAIIPRLIDELPIIALLATQAKGVTVIKNAEELKVKETNRIDVTASELRKMGCQIEITEDGLIIQGKQKLHGAHVDSHGDHRIGMMLAIAAELTDEEVFIENVEAIAVSYPEFFKDLARLKKRVI